MAAPSQTLALAGLILLNFVLAAAALCLFVSGRRRPRQQVPPPPPRPLEPAAAGEAEAAEEEGGGGGERRRRRRARRKRQQQQEEEGSAAVAAEGGGGGNGEDGDRDAAAKAAGKEALLPRRPQFPLASVAGALQRRINARYDDLARASEAQCLTIEQVRRRPAAHYPSSTRFCQGQGSTCFCLASQCVCEVNVGRHLAAWVTSVAACNLARLVSKAQIACC